MPPVVVVSGAPSVTRPPVPAIAALLLGFGVALAVLSPERPLQGPVMSEPSPEATPGKEVITMAGILARLAEADSAWTPRAEPLPDGRIRYHYRRRHGDPALTIQQIQALIANPPTFGPERTAIKALLTRLERVGVIVQLTEPRKRGAAAEWDPAKRTIRIRPRVVGKGSREFAKVLNHEAIHVAQSCSGGRLQGMPRPLGLNDALPPTLASVLNEPLYQQASALERRLEREAYAHQDRLGLGARLVQLHCLKGRAADVRS